jgi:hypothetical protein
MPLFSLFVEHEGKPFTTQLVAASAHDAVFQFFAHPMAMSATPALTPEDIIYITPMEGLVNLWAACAGREGRYVSITCARTIARQSAVNSVAPATSGGVGATGA